MSEPRRLGERFPLRFRTRLGRCIHAGRTVRWHELALIEAACGGVNPPNEGDEYRVSPQTVPTCQACARRITRLLSRSEILAINRRAAPAGEGEPSE